MPARAVPSALVLFLGGRGPDAAGRFLEDILDWDDAALEATHDYIQWLFPLPTPSAAAPGSPVLTAEDIEAVRHDPVAQGNLRRAAERMRGFYEANSHWLVAHDHNHLRISRVIRSLRLLLGHDEAVEFFEAIMRLVGRAGEPVSATSIEHWQDAAGV